MTWYSQIVKKIKGEGLVGSDETREDFPPVLLCIIQDIELICNNFRICVVSHVSPNAYKHFFLKKKKKKKKKRFAFEHRIKE
jgi:hypothetical protein